MVATPDGYSLAYSQATGRPFRAGDPAHRGSCTRANDSCLFVQVSLHSVAPLLTTIASSAAPGDRGCQGP